MVKQIGAGNDLILFEAPAGTLGAPEEEPETAPPTKKPKLTEPEHGDAEPKLTEPATPDLRTDRKLYAELLKLREEAVQLRAALDKTPKGLHLSVQTGDIQTADAGAHAGADDAGLDADEAEAAEPEEAVGTGGDDADDASDEEMQ